MRLQTEGVPNAADRAGARTDPSRQGSGATPSDVAGKRPSVDVRALSTSASLNLRGVPDRGSPDRPPRSLPKKRERQLPTF